MQSSAEDVLAPATSNGARVLGAHNGAGADGPKLHTEALKYTPVDTEAFDLQQMSNFN